MTRNARTHAHIGYYFTVVAYELLGGGLILAGLVLVVIFGIFKRNEQL